jgi:hypothetical protein
MVRNSIREYISIFYCTERNSELCSLPRNSSEQNYGSLLLFLFHGTEFRVVFSSVEGFRTEFRDFMFCGTTGIPSEITICSVYSVFRGIIFLSEIPNPNWTVIPLSSFTNFYLGFSNNAIVNVDCGLIALFGKSARILNLMAIGGVDRLQNT